MNDQELQMFLDQQSSAIVLQEGSKVDHANDRGGATNFGISLSFLRSLGTGQGGGDIDGDGDIDKDDISAVSRDRARTIFAHHFFLKPKLNLLPDACLPVMWDMSVNHGAGGAVTILQRVINKAGFGPVKIDGGCGPATCAAAQRAAVEMGPYFVNAIVDERKNYMNAIVERDPSQVVFIKGWLRRAETFRVGLN